MKVHIYQSRETGKVGRQNGQTDPEGGQAENRQSEGQAAGQAGKTKAGKQTIWQGASGNGPVYTLYITRLMREIGNN